MEDWLERIMEIVQALVSVRKWLRIGIRIYN
jgi:hypothetical protein